MNITTLLRSSALALALALSCATVSATNVSKTSGDLSDPAFWGGTLPTDTIAFKCGVGNFTITRDVSFAGMYLDWTNVKIDASANNPTITMTGPVDMYTGRTFIFKGGTYDFGGTAAFNTGSWGDNHFRNDRITLDGCVFTNSSAINLQNNNGPGCTYTLQNGSGLYINGHLVFTPGSVSGSGLSLSVLSGSTLKCRRIVSDNVAVTRDLPVVVSGAGSSLVATGNPSGENWTAFGRKSNGVRLVVDDGAHVDFTANGSGFYLGAEGSSQSNEVTVAGGSTAAFPYVYLGGWGGTGRNVFRVLDGATVSAWNFHLGGDNANVRDNELVVSNATLNVSSLFTDASKGSGATIRLQGANPKINILSSSGGAGQFVNSTTIVFDVPLGGYATGPIVTAPNGGIWGDSSTTFVVNGLEENVRKLDQKKIFWLMHSSTGAQFNNSGLPIDLTPEGEPAGRCTLCTKAQLTASEQGLFPEADPRDLFLRIKPVLSTTLFIR